MAQYTRINATASVIKIASSSEYYNTIDDMINSGIYTNSVIFKDGFMYIGSNGIYRSTDTANLTVYYGIVPSQGKSIMIPESDVAICQGNASSIIINDINAGTKVIVYSDGQKYFIINGDNIADAVVDTNILDPRTDDTIFISENSTAGLFDNCAPESITLSAQLTCADVKSTEFDESISIGSTIYKLKTITGDTSLDIFYYNKNYYKANSSDISSTDNFVQIVSEQTPDTNTKESVYTNDEISDNLEKNLEYDLSRQATKNDNNLFYINRFKFTIPDGIIGTRGFIFMTRPDLNLSEYGFVHDESGVRQKKNNGSYELAKTIATFDHVKSLPGLLGSRIFGLLECNGSDTFSLSRLPWLCPITNCSLNYNTQDREVDTTDAGETFHGNKVVYAEPTFKYKTAGRVTIEFRDNKNLALFYMIKTWVEYMQMVSTGMWQPKRSHIAKGELDYAVSLYYILTDETMENIIYHEKLTGVFPLTVPDSLFGWDSNNKVKNLNYSIEFAYSMRSVQKPSTLAEINYQYIADDVKDTTPESISGYKSSIKNPSKFIIDKILSSSKYYDSIKDFYNLSDEQLENLNNGYMDIKNGIISTQYAKFLPNYIPAIRSHGVPYVTGPYITSELDADYSRKLKLRWV